MAKVILQQENLVKVAVKVTLTYTLTLKSVSEYDQEIPQSPSADNHHETPGRKTEQSN